MVILASMWDMSWDAQMQIASRAMDNQFVAIGIGTVVMVVLAIAYIKWELVKGA